MTLERKIPYCLFLLRISVFLVMLMWTLDKFIRPSHASIVYETFYLTPAFGSTVSYIIGGLELIIIVGFLFGIKKTFTYGVVLTLHSISTLSTYNQYFAPFQEINLLFFAAIPMLAACITLFTLRDHDTFLTVS